MASLPTTESTSSFWHSEPSEFLIGHRTTPHLPSEADVVIVGSGITGASAARYLAEDERAKGLSVVMLDAREACWCATGRVWWSISFTLLLLPFRSLFVSSRCSNTVPVERRPLSTPSLRLHARRRRV